MRPNLISQLDIGHALKSRITQTYPCECDHSHDSLIPTSENTAGSSSSSSSSGSKKAPLSSTSSTSTSTSSTRNFVLYLPTNNLRKDQNPAFALACHIANYFNLPLIVLAVVLDDHGHVLPHSHSPANTSSAHTSSSSQAKLKPVVMTSRRLAFTLEALSDASPQWHKHGAGIAIRVHGNENSNNNNNVQTNHHDDTNNNNIKARSPDHLTLSSRATAVIVDEPFVHPFLSFVEQVERSCHRKKVPVPCFRVDGNTTVPPCSVLTRTRIPGRTRAETQKKVHTNTNTCIGTDADSMIYWKGVPAKAWMWQKKTEHLRKDQIAAAMNGEFDAPPLCNRIEDANFFLEAEKKRVESGTGTGSDEKMTNGRDGVGYQDEYSENLHTETETETDGQSRINTIQMDSGTFPLSWRKMDNAAPGLRPWSVSELTDLYTSSSSDSIKKWSMQWPGADHTVPPCAQTLGTCRAGMQRWNNFVRPCTRYPNNSQQKGTGGGLVYYGKRRTDPLKPHASSRMSCYLNLGIVSIFRIVHEVKMAQRNKIAGADKFEEEIVKWREMSYAHAFSRGDYHCASSVPQWAIRWIQSECNKHEQGRSPSGNYVNYASSVDAGIVHLEDGTTGNEKWDAMQRYLINTGELHNNVRMTWGKELVHWGAKALLFSSNSSSLDDDDDHDPTTSILQTLCYLNDRFALDGLSPPSYAGLLWCIGWSDKPGRNGGISTKPASRYKISAPAFQQAEKILMEGAGILVEDSNENFLCHNNNSATGSQHQHQEQHQTSILSSLKKQGTLTHCDGRKRKADSNSNTSTRDIASSRTTSRTLDHFFKRPK